MDLWMLLLCVIPTLVKTITISPNGNSPETKIIGRMMVDKHKINRETIVKDEMIQKNNIKRNSYLPANTSKLAINERYRRLIPYMTFYYANDLVTPTTEAHNDINVEVEKAKIIEAGTIRANERQPKIIYTPHRHNNVPRYQGNRLTQFNIASSNPTKLLYRDIAPVLYQNPNKISSGHTPILLEHNSYDNRDNPHDHYIPKQIKAPSVPFSAPTRKPYTSLYQNEDYLPSVQYFSDQEGSPKFKLIPYEQTPPIKSHNIISSKQHYTSSAIIQNEPIYIKPRPSHHAQPFYTNKQVQPRKPSATISEIYYERRQPIAALVEPVVESGFQPIVNTVLTTTESPLYSSTQYEVEVPYHNIKNDKQQELHVIESVTIAPKDSTLKSQYVIEQPPFKATQSSVTLAELLNSLQVNKSIPKPITRENVSASIRTLLQVLNILKATNKQNEVEAFVVSTPKPFENLEIPVKTPSPVASTTSQPQDLYEEHYLAPVQTPSQHIDDYPTSGGSTQRFPLPVTSDEEGGTPGRPGVDYPILTLIPPTKFDCKTQRYKGFFADTETRCQVWHYCDLNGGQASFLCPNGTIFSQAALTCDWWFNVKCSSTAQLYVLNESLYKYILPHSPKFPEDYSGPLVDKYLTLKFKEMEEQFKKNKNKKVTTEKNDSDEESNSNESTEKDSSSEANAGIDTSLVNQADVTVESSGNSGNVQRLQDE